MKNCYRLSVVCASVGLAAGAAMAQDACENALQVIVSEPPSVEGLFGISLAARPDLIAVGASDDSLSVSNGGAIYLFEPGVSGWEQTRRIESEDIEPSDFVGYSIALDGDTLVSGAWGEGSTEFLAGAAYVWERDFGGPGAWGQRAKLLAPDGGMSDLFGLSVAVAGDTIAVGAPLDNASGQLDRGGVYIFRRDAGTGDWIYRRKLVASDPNTDGEFGSALAMTNDLLVVGSTGSNGAGIGSGAAYLFGRNVGGTNQWGLIKKLTGSDVNANDQFGNAVAIEGDRIVVAAKKRDRNGLFSGAVFVFERDAGGPGNWGEVDTFTAAVPENQQEFGESVVLKADTMLVGAIRTTVDAGDDAGTAHLFRRDELTGLWSEALVVSSQNGTGGALFGSSVGIIPGEGGLTAVIGARGDGVLIPFTGSVAVVDIGLDCTVPCPADLTGDGVLNFFDVSAFLMAFNAQEPAADFAEPPGVWNFFDVSAFLGAFGAGCP